MVVVSFQGPKCDLSRVAHEFIDKSFHFFTLHLLLTLSKYAMHEIKHYLLSKLEVFEDYPFGLDNSYALVVVGMTKADRRSLETVSEKTV